MELFGTAGIRGDARETVTPALALQVGQAAGAEAVDAIRSEAPVCQPETRQVSGDAAGDAVEFVVARDGRETGEALVAAMVAGLQSAGADTVEIGQAATPALAHASQGRYGVAITASHNPPQDNGIKLFRDGVEYSGDAEARIEERVAADVGPTEWDAWGTGTDAEALPAYREAVVEYARGLGAPLDEKEIVVDCGNGMASTTTPAVLRELGAEVVTLNANVDGHFPGRESKPTGETLGDCIAFMEEGDVAERSSAGNQNASRSGDADFGIAHDGDADRIVVLDGDGGIVHEDTVLAMLAEEYTRESDAADPVVVTTPNASARIDERVREAGGRVERVALGYLHDGIAEAREGGGDVVFAAEPWKHVHTGFGGWIDGVCSAAVLSRLFAERPLAERRDPISERPYRKVSVPCPDERKGAAMAELADSLPAAFPEATVDDEYGVRLELPDASWLLVRPSGTEPYLRIYAESDEVDTLVSEAREVVEAAVEN